MRSRAAVWRVSAAVLALAFTAAAQRAESSREVRRSHAWSAGQRVEIENRFGQLTVRGGPGREVQVVAHIQVSARSKEEADKAVSQIDVTLESTPAAITIRTKLPEESWVRSSRASYSVTLEAAVPENAPLRARNSFGRTELSGLKSEVEATNQNGNLRDSDGAGRHTINNSFGSVEVVNVRGVVAVQAGNGAANISQVDQLNLTNRFGKTTVSGVARSAVVNANNGAIEVSDVGGAATVEGSFGTVTALRVKGPLTVRNSNGKVTASQIGGHADIKNSFGDVELSGLQQGARVTSGNASININGVAGDSVVQGSFGGITIINPQGAATVANQNGAVRVTGAKSSVNAKTTFGAIEISGAGGPIEATGNNGSITIGGLPPKCVPITARTSFGAVRVALPAGAGYDLLATTSFGRIKSDFEVAVKAGSQPEHRLEGRIGSGGCALNITNSNGPVEITKAP